MTEKLSDKKDEFIYMAKLAEQTERFEDMVTYMKQVIEITKDLKEEEINLLSIAYKNAVGSRRTAWRAITAYEMKEQNNNTKFSETIGWYKKKIEEELEQICNEILNLLDTQLLRANNEADSKIFYYKMRGDYNRYLSEFLSAENQTKAIENAQQSYKDALQFLDKKPKTNPLRLGVALNFSVFYYEIKNDLKAACDLAKETFEQAINELEDLDDEQYKDSTTIMQLLRDNLTVWQAELAEEQKEKNNKQ